MLSLSVGKFLEGSGFDLSLILKTHYLKAQSLRNRFNTSLLTLGHSIENIY